MVSTTQPDIYHPCHSPRFRSTLDKLHGATADEATTPDHRKIDDALGPLYVGNPKTLASTCPSAAARRGQQKSRTKRKAPSSGAVGRYGLNVPGERGAALRITSPHGCGCDGQAPPATRGLPIRHGEGPGTEEESDKTWGFIRSGDVAGREAAFGACVCVCVRKRKIWPSGTRRAVSVLLE